MFVGHYAPALIAAAHVRRPGLGAMFVAAQLVDIGFFAFVLADIEHLRIVPGITEMNAMDLYDMPYTHSLLGGAVWATAFAVLVWAATRSRAGALAAGLVVLSHWVLDLLVHRPDLTLAGGPPKLGFGLWNLPAVEMPLELLLTAGAFAWFAWRTRPVNAQGRIGLWVLAALLAVFQAIDWSGNVPASISEMAATGLAAYLLAALVAWWVGRNRELAG